jgi:hypothetical protein
MSASETNHESGSQSEPQPFMKRVTMGSEKPTPDITYSMISLRNAGILASRSQFFSNLIDSEGNGKDLQAEDDKDIRRVLGPNVSSVFKPTYSFEELIRYHEAWREDGIASMCVELLAQAILGDHFRTVIDVNEEFESDDDRKAALDQLKANPKLKSYKREIDIINKDVKATDSFKALFIQSAVFGSGAAIIEKDKVTSLPTTLKILPSMSLGRRFVDKRSWRLIGLEYLDYKFPQSILKAEDIFYIALRNYHMSPGTYHYGYSLFEKIISLSETNRVINQRNLPETNFRLWSPMLLIKMPNNVNQTVMNQMQNDVANGAGNAIVTNQQVNIDPVLINVSLQEMTTERSQNNLEIIRQMQFPELLYNPDIMNRATSQELMETWNVFVLGPYQTWLSDIIQEQWIDPIIKVLIENDQLGIIDEPLEGITPPEEKPITTTKPAKPQPNPNADQSAQQSQSQQQKPTPTTAPGQPNQPQPKPTPQPKISFTDNKSLFNQARDPVTGEIKVSRLPWKIKVVFDPINLDTFLDKVKAYMILFNNGSGPIGGERVLRGVGLEEDIPEFQAREAQKQEFQQQQFNLQQKVIDVNQLKKVQADSTTPSPNNNANKANTGFSGDVAGSLNKSLQDSTKVSAHDASLKEEKAMLYDKIVPAIIKKLDEI